MLELLSKALQSGEEWQRWLKEWSSLNKGGTIPSRDWMQLFLISKTLGVALLPLQKFLSKFISHRGISPRPLLAAASGGVGEEAEEKAQLSSDLGCRRNGSGLLWKSCEVMRWGIMRLESRSWRSRGPAAWPWPCRLTSLFWPSRPCLACDSTALWAIRAWCALCTVLLLLRDVGVPPFIPLPHATSCKSTRLEMLRQAFSGAWPQPAMGCFPFTSVAVDWETRQPRSWLSSPSSRLQTPLAALSVRRRRGHRVHSCGHACSTPAGLM